MQLDKEKPLFKELVEQVRNKVINPVDKYEMAAIMESMGWNDTRVQADFGVNDIFDIAQTVWEVAQPQPRALPVLRREILEPHSNSIRVWRSIDLKKYLGKETDLMNQISVSAYLKRCSVIAILSLITAIIILQFKVIDNQTTSVTLIGAIIVLSLLVLASMNSLILFSLGQPTWVINSTIIALTVGVLVGFILTQWTDYSVAVVGLFLGSIVVTVLTTHKVINVLKNLDYYLYVSHLNNKAFSPEALK